MANLIVTDAGIAAIRNAQATGTNAVYIASIKVGSGKWTPDAGATDLQSVIKAYTAVAGGAVGDNVIHVEAVDTSDDHFTAYELGIFLDDGTLLAVQSETTPILEKSSASQALLAIDVLISGTEDVDFICPDPNFQVPPATTETMGVVELATVEEALAGTDAVRCMTPADVKAVADLKANVNHASTAATFGQATGTNYGHTRLSDSTSSTSSTSGGYAATPKAVKDAKDACIQADTYKVAKAGDTVTGAIHSTYGKANASGVVEQFGGEMASSDKWRIGAGATASNSGFVEIATADDGNEPIYARQYSGNFATKVREVALLDGSGRTTFPVSVTCPSFVGALTGNASTATKLQTARAITVKDNAQANAGPAQNFDGSANIVLRLPAVIKGTLDGNAATATKAVGDTNGARIDTTYLKLAGGTVTGTLVLSRATDAQGTADNGPALVVGGTRAQKHIEIDNDEIMAKANGTSVSPLYLNHNGGAVYAEGVRVAKGASKGGTAKGVYADANGNLQPLSATVGGTARGVYLNGGQVTAMSATVGSATKPIFSNAGTLTASNANVGGATQPVRLAGGTITACEPYSSIAMAPVDNGWGMALNTRYTADRNGFLLVRLSGGSWGKNDRGDFMVGDRWYTMRQASAGSWNGGGEIFCTIPVRKGWAYQVNSGGDGGKTGWFFPAMA